MGERFLRKVLENLGCGRDATLGELCRKLGTDTVVDRIRRSALILVSEKGRPARAYTLPFYKYQVESRPQWTVEEFVRFLEEQAKKKIEYIKHRYACRLKDRDARRGWKDAD